MLVQDSFFVAIYVLTFYYVYYLFKAIIYEGLIDSKK